LGISLNFDRTGQQEKKRKKLVKNKAGKLAFSSSMGFARTYASSITYEDYATFGHFAYL
jgi:hypothetical protein